MTLIELMNSYPLITFLVSIFGIVTGGIIIVNVIKYITIMIRGWNPNEYEEEEEENGD